jgi:chloride channel 7
LIPWLIYAGMAMIFGSIASAMTTYWGPGAAGSGVAELIGYLNGINYQGFLSVPTLVTKIVGVTLAVCAKLCVGKEGPLAHIGSILGPLILYLPGFEFFRNDE